FSFIAALLFLLEPNAGEAMGEGEWVRLGATLSFNEGLYRIIEITPQTVIIRGEDGRKHHILRDQFMSLSKTPATRKRRLAKKTDFFAQDEGMLAAADYHVGNTGHTRAHRRAVLTWVFEASVDSLPRAGDDN